MDEARDFAGISIPFTIGITVSAVTEQAAGVSCADAAILAAVCTGLTAYVWKRGCQKMHCAPLLFLIGIFCGRTSLICGEANLPRPGGIDAIRSAIYSSGFQGENTKEILSAFIIGEKDLLSKELKRAFRASGASHLLALSGLHLGMIYLVVTKILIILGNSRAGAIARSSISILICLWYTLATGTSPSVERAFLFICLNETAKLSPGRRRNPTIVLLFAMMLQLTVSPSQISSVSFQMSYLAIAGIIFLYPKLRGIYPETVRMDPMKKIWDTAALCISCQVFTAPLAWLYFRTFPRHFLLTNLMTLPIVEFLMISGIVAIALQHLFGYCPELLVRFVDLLAGILEFCLGTISSLDASLT